MPITRLNNNSITSVTALPSGITSLPSSITSASGLDLNAPYFSATNNTPQGLANATDTQIDLQTINFDSHNAFNNTSSSATLNGISVDRYSFAPPVSGRYIIGATVYFQTVADGVAIEMKIRKNNGDIMRDMAHASVSKDLSAHASTMMNANGTSDDFQVYVRLDGAGDNTYYGQAYMEFFGYKIG